MERYFSRVIPKPLHRSIERKTSRNFSLQLRGNRFLSIYEITTSVGHNFAATLSLPRQPDAILADVCVGNRRPRHLGLYYEVSYNSSAARLWGRAGLSRSCYFVGIRTSHDAGRYDLVPRRCVVKEFP